MSASYYTSDTPCRRCGATLRYRDLEFRGMCAGCISIAEAGEMARRYVGKADEQAEGDDEDEA